MRRPKKKMQKNARIAQLEASLEKLERRQTQPARDAAVKIDSEARTSRRMFREGEFKDDGNKSRREKEEVRLESAKQNLDSADDHIQQAEKLADRETAASSNRASPAPKEEFYRLRRARSQSRPTLPTIPEASEEQLEQDIETEEERPLTPQAAAAKVEGDTSVTASRQTIYASRSWRQSRCGQRKTKCDSCHSNWSKQPSTCRFGDSSRCACT